MHERALGFATLPSAAIAMELKIFAPEGRLQEHQLKEVFMALGLPHSQLDIQDSAFSKFFLKFRENKYYSVKQLGLVGVLLGAGSIAQKTEVVFNLCDEHCTAELTTAQVSDVLVNLITIACVYLPFYAEMEMRALKDAERLAKLKKYTGSMNRRLNSACSLIQQTMLEDRTTLTKATFQTVVTQKCSYLLDAHPLRGFVMTVTEGQQSGQVEDLFATVVHVETS